MSKNNLKVVKSAKDKDLENKEKNKALEAAISQITDNFGKGSVMKLGQKKSNGYRVYFHRLIKLGFGTRHWWITERKNC